MIKQQTIFQLLVGVYLLTLLVGSASASNTVTLLDPALSKWDTYLSYKFTSDYSGDIPKDEAGHDIPPIGLNPDDSLGVFSIVGDDNATLRVSGEYYGALTTKAEYENYRFKVQVKWGEKIWPARAGKLRDTGILYHAIGPHGAEYFRSWMLSHEFQIMEGHMGDYWKQANGAIDIRAYPREYIMSPVADSRADWLAVGEGTDGENFVMRSANHESDKGEWTELELISFNGQSLHIVNGEVVMILRNSRYVDSNGKRVPLTKGKIQLQSEASEVFFRNITITPIQQMPTIYDKYFKTD